MLGFSDDRFADTFQYHVNGQVKRFTYGNGQIYQSQQNTLQQTSRVFVQKPNIAWSVDLNYTYDDNGRVLTVGDGIDAANDRTYTYDGLGRLDTANSPLWGDASYGYDGMGNLLTKTFSNWNGAERTVTNSYDAATNRVASTADSTNINYGFDYDSRGNITQTGGLKFTYDMADQPTAMEPAFAGGKAPNTGAAVNGTYAYDGNLKRVKSIINGVIRYNVYDAAGMLVYVEEEDNPNTPEDEYSETEYLHGAGMTLARIRTDATAAGVFTYLHPDHLGSPIAGTKEDGTMAFTEQYTPFGEALLNPAANDNQSGFTGHIKDSDTGLNYMQARYYDPNIGRFLSVDPVTFLQTGNPGYFNRYSYTFNDPINNTDPDGMQVKVELKGNRITQTDLAGHSFVHVEDTQSGEVKTIEGGPTDSGGDVGNPVSESINKAAGHEDALLKADVYDKTVTEENRGRDIETLDSTTVNESFDSVVGKAEAFTDNLTSQGQNYDALTNSSNTAATGAFEAMTGKLPANKGSRAYPGGRFRAASRGERQKFKQENE